MNDKTIAALKLGLEAINDLIAVAVNEAPSGSWNQNDYDEWHAAREAMEKALVELEDA